MHLLILNNMGNRSISMIMDKYDYAIKINHKTSVYYHRKGMQIIYSKGFALIQI